MNNASRELMTKSETYKTLINLVSEIIMNVEAKKNIRKKTSGGNKNDN